MAGAGGGGGGGTGGTGHNHIRDTELCVGPLACLRALKRVAQIFPDSLKLQGSGCRVWGYPLGGLRFRV